MCIFRHFQFCTQIGFGLKWNHDRPLGAFLNSSYTLRCALCIFSHSDKYRLQLWDFCLLQVHICTTETWHFPESTDLFQNMQMLCNIFMLRGAKLIVWSLRSFWSHPLFKFIFYRSRNQDKYQNQSIALNCLLNCLLIPRGIACSILCNSNTWCGSPYWLHLAPIWQHAFLREQVFR